MLSLPRIFAADNGDNTGAANFDQANLAHQVDKVWIFSDVPVISKIKLSMVASTTRAR